MTRDSSARNCQGFEAGQIPDKRALDGTFVTHNVHRNTQLPSARPRLKDRSIPRGGRIPNTDRKREFFALGWFAANSALEYQQTVVEVDVTTGHVPASTNQGCDTHRSIRLDAT